MYKRKGGHIYTKVTTNRRVANLNQDNWLYITQAITFLNIYNNLFYL
jgi:hypothetical protein